ncbi:MAG TPA: MgtC/SapB family protein [Actinomycetota bacterium]|jgi:putative Mg2+ transporter-C (MgtC) family protein|nr:MgtC/SapB family protein [Actinomycetota bacterium]
MPLDVELALRLLGAALVGALIGFERELRDQPAGFRTHILVALGSCVFTVISAYGFGALAGERGYVRVDPSRIAAQIVTGIGFLGAGVIFRQGLTVRGLTTAASLWVTAALGMAVGAGAYIVAGAGAAVALLTIAALRPVRRAVRGLRREQEELILEVQPETPLDQLMKELGAAGIRVDHLRVADEGEDRTELVLSVRIPPETSTEEVMVMIRGMGGVRGVEWSR